MKAYTKVELQVNMLKLYKYAYNKVEDWISDKKDDGNNVGFDDIADPTTSSSKTFTEARGEGLYDDYKDGITRFDEQTWEELQDYAAWIGETIDEEK